MTTFAGLSSTTRVEVTDCMAGFGHDHCRSEACAS